MIRFAKILPASLLLLFVVGASITATTPKVSAASFNKNNLIYNRVFDDYTTMTPTQINSFLNSFSGSCISPNSGFKAVNPVGYNPTDGYLYGSMATAGTVIYNAAKAYEINPRVLLTTLQKEQSLVTGGGGCSTRTISKAMGYGCPDSGGSYSYSGISLYSRNGTTYTSVSSICVNDKKKAGFTQQIIRAAWMLKYSRMRSEGKIDFAIIKGNWDNSDDLNATYSGYMTEGCFKRSKYQSSCTNYDGYATIDSTAVHMDNGATAALYRYTPHFSGNQHFDTIFLDWFGSLSSSQGGDAIIAIDDRYSDLGSAGGILGAVVDDSVNKNGDVYWKSYQNGYILWSPSTGAWESMGSIRSYWASIGYSDSKLGLPVGPIKVTADTNGQWQEYENGYIIGSPSTGYWESMGSIRDRWSALGLVAGTLGYPSGPIHDTADGIGRWQPYQNGYIVWGPSTGAWESMGGIRSYWEALGLVGGKMGYPIGPVNNTSDSIGRWQQYQNGYIIGNATTGYWESMGSIRSYWEALGLVAGKMGYPTGSIKDTSDGKGRWQSYENGYIVWGHTTGAWESMGSIRTYWSSLGLVDSKLGYPTGPIKATSDGIGQWQSYQHGYIVGKAATGYWESMGSIRSYWKSHGLVSGSYGYPTNSIQTDGSGKQTQTYQGGTINYLKGTGAWGT